MERKLPAHYLPLVEDLEHHEVEFTSIQEDAQFGPHLLINTAGENRGKILAMLNARIDAAVRAERTQKTAAHKEPGFLARLFGAVPKEQASTTAESLHVSREMREHHMPKTYATLDVMGHKGGVGTGDLARSALEDWARAHAQDAFVDATPIRARKTERKVAIRVVPRNGPR